nr:NADH dehydrogenase subunit 6 [Gyrodactylus sp. FZ-2021]
MILFFLLSSFLLVSCSYSIFVSSGFYCLFLITLTFISSVCLLFLNLSFWYCLVLLIIYIGGVYVLLLFVSIYSYNSFSFSNLISVIFIFSFFFIFFYFTYIGGLNFWLDMTNFSLSYVQTLELVSVNNWVSYIFILLCILISFFIFSFIFSNSSSYIR